MQPRRVCRFRRIRKSLTPKRKSQAFAFQRRADGAILSPMEPHSIVIVSLHSPKERLWGELVEVSIAGVTLRGIDLGSFDDFVSQVLHPEGERIGLPTLFFPMQRVERIALDEPRGSIPSMAEKFAVKI